MTSATSPLQRPLPSLAAWTALFREAPIPVLADTAEQLELMRANEDAVDANLLGETIAHDPLMTLKVMAHAAAHRHQRMVTDAETVTAAIVMMGISPFFRAFGPQPTLEEHLQDWPGALEGLHEVLRRSERSARFALGFAVHRRDHDAAILHSAALLHDFGELLLWCHAPALALEIRGRQRDDNTLRSADVQQQVLNITLPELEYALTTAWRLPDLLVRMSDPAHTEHPQVRSVVLAIQLARHTVHGWDNAALPDDVVAIAQLLNMGVGPTLALLHELDD